MRIYLHLPLPPKLPKCRYIKRPAPSSVWVCVKIWPPKNQNEHQSTPQVKTQLPCPWWKRSDVPRAMWLQCFVTRNRNHQNLGNHNVLGIRFNPFEKYAQVNLDHFPSNYEVDLPPRIWVANKGQWSGWDANPFTFADVVPLSRFVSRLKCRQCWTENRNLNVPGSISSLYWEWLSHKAFR